ncbi:hypothetical protein ES708_26229 [subsurface metagenome]
MGSLKKLWGWYPTGSKWVKLQVDSTGKVLLSSIQTKARAYLSANQLNIPSGIVTLINLDTVSYDIGSNFNTATHKFVVPITGYYLLSSQLTWLGGTVIANQGYTLSIKKNGVGIATNDTQSSTTSAICNTYSNIFLLAATNEIELWAKHWAGVNTIDIRGDKTHTFMSIHLLSV